MKSAIFSMSSNYFKTTAGEWNSMKSLPVPWADLQTDSFMMNVPLNWINDKSFSQIESLLKDYDTAIEACNELMGY